MDNKKFLLLYFFLISNVTFCAQETMQQKKKNMAAHIISFRTAQKEKRYTNAMATLIHMQHKHNWYWKKFNTFQKRGFNKHMSSLCGGVWWREWATEQHEALLLQMLPIKSVVELCETCNSQAKPSPKSKASPKRRQTESSSASKMAVSESDRKKDEEVMQDLYSQGITVSKVYSYLKIYFKRTLDLEKKEQEQAGTIQNQALRIQRLRSEKSESNQEKDIVIEDETSALPAVVLGSPKRGGLKKGLTPRKSGTPKTPRVSFAAVARAAKYNLSTSQEISVKQRGSIERDNAVRALEGEDIPLLQSPPPLRKQSSPPPPPSTQSMSSIIPLPSDTPPPLPEDDPSSDERFSLSTLNRQAISAALDLNIFDAELPPKPDEHKEEHGAEE